MAIAGFFSPTSATVTVSPGSDLYVTQTADGTLLVDDNSAFAHPQSTPSISKIPTLAIASGERQVDLGVPANNSPMYGSSNQTGFVLRHADVFDDGELYGELTCIQPDKSVSKWTFTSWNGVTSGDPVFSEQNIRITSGPGYGGTYTRLPIAGGIVVPFTSAPVGYYVPSPASIKILTNPSGDMSGANGDQTNAWTSTLGVTWNRPLSAAQQVRLSQIEYKWLASVGLFGDPDRSEREAEAGLTPTANGAESTFVLPLAASVGGLGIIDGTLQGAVVLPSPSGVLTRPQRLNFTTTRGSNALNFDSLNVLKNPAGGQINVTGTYDAFAGTITLNFFAQSKPAAPSPGTGLPGLGGVTTPTIVTAPQDPGEVVIDAQYAVYSAGQQQSTVTFYAGHDITNAIDVQLLSPGSSVSFDSPVLAAAGNVAVLASNIAFRSTVRTGPTGTLTIGQPALGLAIPGTVTQSLPLESTPVRAAKATVLVANGQVQAVVPVVGAEGAGYSVSSPPTVVIGQPENVAATARLSAINGLVTELQIVDAGSGYTTPPAVRLSAPNDPAGVQATATAVLDTTTGVLTGFIITRAGSGYSNPPNVIIDAPPPPALGLVARPTQQAVARAVVKGAITTIAVPNGGYGYVTAPSVTIKGGDGKAAAVATIKNGAVTLVTVTNGGDNYTFDNNTTITIDPPPVNLSPNNALAEAVVDPQGRVTGYIVKHPGSGYGNVPSVAVDAPQRSAGINSTNSATGVVTNGRVSALRESGAPVIQVKSGGAGFAAATTTVTVAPPAAGGRAATATAVVLNGTIVDIRVTDNGVGYVIGETPVVTVKGDGSGADVTSYVAAGYGYRAAPRIVIDPPPPGSGGVAAAAEATLDGEGRIVGFILTYEGSGYDSTKTVKAYVAPPEAITRNAEKVAFNAAVAASVYQINVGNDLNTDTPRGSIFVSQTSSLGADFGATLPSSEISVRAEQADVLVEGRVNAKAQTYFLPSEAAAGDLSPYTFSTRSSGSGEQVGLIRGEVVQVLLANNFPTPGDEGSVVFNTVDLQTAINSIRVRAAAQNGVPFREPFPYAISIDEVGDLGGGDAEAPNLTIDAVAASSFPIAIHAAGTMRFTSALATADDVYLTAGGDFSLDAPLSTTDGRIVLEGNNVSVNNSLQVTAARRDETRSDIVLNARQGNVFLGGVVSAVNGVKVTQQNPRAVAPTTSPAPNVKDVPIPDRGLASQSLQVTDTLPYDFLTVRVNITHPTVEDLSATLVSPNGTRVLLFSADTAKGGSLTKTVFDSRSVVSLFTGTAPYTGTFAPQSSLAVLNFGATRAGVWKLEVNDVSAGATTGVINSFTIDFYSEQEVAGYVSGFGRIQADTLELDAAGYVGRSDGTTSSAQFYLSTDVNTLSGRAGRNVAVSDSDDVYVPSLVTGGLVALRAAGVDRADGSAALRGRLDGVTSLDLTAPSGSIDVSFASAGTVTLGDATAIRLGRSTTMLAGGNVSIRSLTGTASPDDGNIAVLDAPLAGSGARRVRGVITSTSLNAVYNAGIPGTYASTLTSKSTGVLAVPGVSDLRVGDRVLLATSSSPRNGVYEVVALGSQWTKWVLRRAADSDTGEELPSGSFVGVGDGPVPTSYWQLRYSATQSLPFTKALVSIGQVNLVNDISTNDPGGQISFVVGTTAGTLAAAGSLGKTLSLVGANSAAWSTRNPAQPQTILFSSDVSGIELAEPLPEIKTSVIIDGARRYNPSGLPQATAPVTIDGSRITRTLTGLPVSASVPVGGIVIRGSGASGSRVANVGISGYPFGPAVQVTDANNVLLDGVTVGLDAKGKWNPVNVGVWVTGSSAGTTIVGNTLQGAKSAGVLIEGEATGTTLVGNTIGRIGTANAVGVRSTTSGNVNIGLTPVGSGVSVALSRATPVFVLPANIPIESLYIGQSVSGYGMPAGAVIKAIDRGTRAVTLSVNALTTGTGVVLFAAPRRNVVQNNTNGVVVTAGAVTVLNTDIINNASDGMRIMGGVGHVIGRGGLTNTSNAFYGNGRRGISINSAALLDNKAATVAGNYFGLSSLGTASAGTAANVVGAVVVQGQVPVQFVPDSRTGLDKAGNKHRLPTTGSGSVGTPWRPQ
jgi:subtilisin-like proprotein convertase family protein